MKRIITVEATVPDLSRIPDCILAVNEYKVEITLRYNGSLMICDTVEEVQGLYRLLTTEEVERRKKSGIKID